tara:strand:+ start:11519 stop:11788 length:270 start_codon:yes stop_codon:yes gene_type:complete
MPIPASLHPTPAQISAARLVTFQAAHPARATAGMSAVQCSAATGRRQGLPKKASRGLLAVLKYVLYTKDGSDGGVGEMGKVPPEEQDLT